MTDAKTSPTGLVEKAPDADLLREMITFATERLMKPTVGAMSGAPYLGTVSSPLASTVTADARRWERISAPPRLKPL
jgi:putative transposase